MRESPLAAVAASAVTRIALFEPRASIAGRIKAALPRIEARGSALSDPSQNVRSWFDCPFDAMVFNPFCSSIPPPAAMALARGIAGQRPLLALTIDDCAEQRTLAIIHGADDAMHGEGDEVELVVRIAALLRRRAIARAMLACDDLQIDLVDRKVSRAGSLISMPAREFDVLTALARTPGRPVSRFELLRTVWRIDFDPGTNRVDVHISRLRNRIDTGFAFPMLRTVKGIGYALVGRGARSNGIAQAPG